MEVASLLCDSFRCRLCAEENKNGTSLFPIEENEQDLSQLVNKYLPLKVERDGKLPSVICPGCNIQLEATKQFLDLIVDGQSKLRDLFRVQQETLRRQEKQRQQLETALKNVNPKSSVETYTIQSDETGEKFLIQIFSEGPLFPPDHELSLRTEGLERPKRKRGRPPKAPPNTTEEEKLQGSVEDKQQDQDDESEIDGDGRKKRRIKVPLRFLEAVQGKELDRMFKEEGVIDDDSLSEEEPLDGLKVASGGDEVIGRLQSKEGEDLGELVIVNKNTNRIKVKAKEDLPKKKKNYECEICGREFFHIGRYEVHKSFHKNIKYQCGEPNCELQAETKLAIEGHHKEVGHLGITVIESLDNYGQLHLSRSNNESDPLEMELSLPDVLPEEVKEEISKEEECKVENKISCEICGKNFSCKQNYEVHCKAVHENQRPYQCDKCEKSFPYLNSLKCHMLQHSDKGDKIYPCDICKKNFNHPSSLVYHREAEHNNGRRFVCNKCNKSFKHKQLLQRHQLVHSNERPHVCKSCDASFKTRANLLNHMPIHTGEKKYFCSQCSQSFAHKTSLTLHMRWHSGQKPYECDVCMKTFSQKGNLAEHKRIHTGEKPYCCDHCGRKFTTSSQFKLHVKRHTGERPWRCEYCSKTFLHKDTWKCHTRRHRNERPYQCHQCLRGFTEQWALKKHERLHTGEKPYVCEICNKGFADCSNLTKHKKIHINSKVKQEKGTPNIRVMAAPGEVGNNQVLYLTYKDSDSTDGQPQTLVHIMDTLDEIPSEERPANDESSLIAPNDSMDSSTVQVQHLVDQDGLPLSITIADGQQIKVISVVEDGQQNIKGLMPNGTLVPINLSMHEGKAVTEITITDNGNKRSEKQNYELLKSDENSRSSPVTELLDNNIQFLTEDGQKLDNNIQFLTDDGQNVCFVTTYNIDETMNPQYLAMA